MRGNYRKGSLTSLKSRDLYIMVVRNTHIENSLSMNTVLNRILPSLMIQNIPEDDATGLISPGFNFLVFRIVITRGSRKIK